MSRKTDLTSTDVAQGVEGMDAGIARIERPTLHNVVVTRLRDMVIEGLLQPGSRIDLFEGV